MLYGLCFFVFIIIALIFITIQANNFNDFSKTEFNIVGSGGDFTEGNNGMGRDLCKMILASLKKDKVGVDRYYQESLKYQGRMESSLKDIQKVNNSKYSEAIAKAINEQKEIKSLMTKMYELSEAGRTDEAWELYEKRYNVIATSMRNDMDKVMTETDKVAAEYAQNTERLRNIMYVAAILLGSVK